MCESTHLLGSNETTRLEITRQNLLRYDSYTLSHYKMMCDILYIAIAATEHYYAQLDAADTYHYGSCARSRPQNGDLKLESLVVQGDAGSPARSTTVKLPNCAAGFRRV